MISRRHFLAFSTAAVFLPKLSFANTTVALRASPVSLNLIADKVSTALWGFNGSTPGPIVRVNKGARIQSLFTNNLNQPSSIHWHGIRIDNRMDGVPDLTQPAVKPGQHFNYDFIAPDSGTFWYHAHNRSWEQVARGLYGAIIVDEKTPPQVDHDIVVFIDDWRLNRDGSQAGDFDNRHDQAHDGRLGNFFKAIFQDRPAHIQRNERVRLRFINAATDRIFPIQLNGLNGKIVAYDGMPLQKPKSFNHFILAPAQRIDIIADVVKDEIVISYPTRDGLYRLGDLSVRGQVDRQSNKEILPLEANNYVMPNIENAVQLSLTMGGGAMRMGMMGMFSGNIWSFNGVSGMGEAPFYRFKRGQTALINLINDTNFPHAIHLHGHHFHTLKAGELSPLRDTILVDVGEHQKIVCVFNNPGKWLLHCHMLAHQATGMKTWVVVI